uniref:non-structural maintenance of chromosomes element 4 homolog A-like n=1 Tax=Erigeron canadensis TaxID=72917 RepID=UPI001CB9BA8F|nr:non-structural maintenance of chromosomes element 4 homolog A-like [Erigeron canadensis]
MPNVINKDDEDDQKKLPRKEKMEPPIDNDEQDFTQRRFIRSGYLSIQNLIRDRRDLIAAPTSNKFLSIIDEVEGMHHHVKKPREQVSDAEALRELSTTLLASIKVQSTGSLTPSVFVSSVITEYGKKRVGRGIDECVEILWQDIGLHVSPLFMFSGGSCTMLGHMKHEPIPLKVYTSRKRPRSSVKVEKVKPKELESAISKEKSETDKTIATMFDVLKCNTNVCLENLIINRLSFGQTVENLFALSFLVKDGRVVIVVDEKGSHHVSPRNAPASGSIMSGEVAYSHFIFMFGFNDWKLMKDSVAEGSELMPHRSILNHCGASQSDTQIHTVLELQVPPQKRNKKSSEV